MSTAFRVMMTGGQETPPNGSNAGGLGTVIFDSVAVTANYEINVHGLDFGNILGLPAQTANPNDDVGGIHVHNAPFGNAGAIVFGQRNPNQDIDDFSATINTNGSTTFKGVWETTDPASTSINAFAGVLGAAALGTMVPLYFNIHTAGFGAGEIRGQWECIATDNSEVVVGTNQDDILPGLDGNDTVQASRGDDRLDGGLKNDRLYGGRGDDRLDGGDGKDVLRGDAGADVLKGGALADKFLFVRYSDSSVGASDRIMDFRPTQGDVVDISGLDADLSTGGDDAFTIVAAFSGAAGEAVLTYDLASNTTTLALEANGVPGAEFELLMNGDHTSSSGYIL